MLGRVNVTGVEALGGLHRSAGVLLGRERAGGVFVYCPPESEDDECLLLSRPAETSELASYVVAVLLSRRGWDGAFGARRVFQVLGKR